ncbi:MAG: cyclase [Acidimicrobiia bacterium]|jgi:cyclase|nr:cyclase [Acidimicrobiia bacterium]
MSGHGHDHPDQPLDPPRVEEVSDSVYAYIQPDGTWYINNAGFLVADDGIITIDTCATERRTRAFLDAARNITQAPVRTLVNTHFHGDHTHGNYLTWPATIVAHDNCRPAMLAAGISHNEAIFGTHEWGDLRLAPPTLTFPDHVTLYSGDLPVELQYIGMAAHTTGDVVAWLPERSVLFAGDLVFNGGTPFVVMGSVSGALATLDRLRSFGAQTVVPGHGPVCGPEIWDSLERYYRFVQKAAEDAVRSGVSALDAGRQLDLGEFGGLTDKERIVGNLHRAMYELGGGEPGGPMDVRAAILDMVAYNGGKPLRCVV